MSLANYEEKLKVYYESVRKDLDIILTSTIPAQKNLIKTILWVNASILGLIAALMKDAVHVVYAIPFSFSFLAFLVTLFALKDGRTKAFGTPPVEDIDRIGEDDYEKANTYIQMISAARTAFEHNENVVVTRAKKIAAATTFTVWSVASMLLVALVYANTHHYPKEVIVSEKNEDTPVDNRPKMTGGTAKPEKVLYTNSRKPDTLITKSESVKSTETNRQPETKKK